MSHQVQELIDKIKEDGYQAAEQKTKEIEAQAQSQAQKIVADAQAKANQIVENAKAEAKKLEESANAALAQASRDTLIFLSQKIHSLLKAIINENVSEALTSENLARIIENMITNMMKESAAEGVLVTVSPDDLKKLESTALAQLQKNIKSGITLQASADMGGGFLISFDKGKSSFDFSEKSLAEYLSAFLNESMAKRIKSAV